MKKSYRGFPLYGLIILGVLIAAQLFTSTVGVERGEKIDAAEMLAYIEQGAIDRVALQGDSAFAHMTASTLPAE